MSSGNIGMPSLMKKVASKVQKCPRREGLLRPFWTSSVFLGGGIRVTTQTPDEVRETVRDHYAKVAQTDGACGCGPGCCGPKEGASLELGYTADELAEVPKGADMGLGCGTPLTFASLQAGETVLDLGSGGGLDCFLAAKQVGEAGRVIGVDMTPEMVAKARENAARLHAQTVEFRLGEIERLPVEDRSVDVIVSNCVLNLSPDKPSVFREAFRVLRPGGRLAIADIVASAPLPEELQSDAEALAGCIAGAPVVDDVRAMLTVIGFTDVRVDIKPESRKFIRDWRPGSGAEDYVASAGILALKPTGNGCCGTARSSRCC
jgi:SAM-dependent methyltransferase